MSVISVSLMGRFGNTLFQYAYAKAYALEHGCEFQCDPGWVGYQIFQLEDPPIAADLPRRNEKNVAYGEVDICFRTYAQHQTCMIYTQDQIREWFKFKPHLLELAQDYMKCNIAAHLRRGDFDSLSYPMVSKASYYKAVEKFGLLDVHKIWFVSDEFPTFDRRLESGMDFLPDFMVLCMAQYLFRANSSFSWWAAAIGSHSAVYSPRIDGLIGGKEHDVEFELGNHPRLSDHDFVSDLHLP